MKASSTEASSLATDQTIGPLSALERRAVRWLRQRHQATRDTNRVFDEQLGLGERVADRVATFGGSWTFIIAFGVVLAVWVVLNSLLLTRSFDPYPYVFLNLILSMLAAIQAPVIMMSQNRQAAKDRLEAAHDYEVNLKAELEIMQLHEKLDSLRADQLAEITAMQREHRRLLELLLERGSSVPPKPPPGAG